MAEPVFVNMAKDPTGGALRDFKNRKFVRDFKGRDRSSRFHGELIFPERERRQYP